MADNKKCDGPLILIVDDAYAMRRLIQTHLQEAGFQTLMAESAEDALRLAKVNRPALIVTDWMMPKVSGIHLMEMVRADPSLHATPIIICTAKGTRADVVEALKKGVSDFIRKPFNKEILLKKINQLLSAAAAPGALPGATPGTDAAPETVPPPGQENAGPGSGPQGSPP